MKKILIGLVLILAASQIQAQSNPFPSADSLIRFINKYIRNSAVEAFTNLRLNTAMQGIVRFSDSALNFSTRGVDTIFRTPSKDSIIFRINGVRYAVKDSTGVGNVALHNAGTGFRAAKTGTDSIKTFFTDGWLIWDSTSNANGLTIKPDTSANKLVTHRALKDTMYSVLNNISLVSRIEFIQSGSSTTYTDTTLIGRQVLLLTLEGYNVGFTTRTSVYMSFDPTTGTITLNNGAFSDDDQVIILYRTPPIFLTDGSGNFIKDGNGNYIILN